MKIHTKNQKKTTCVVGNCWRCFAVVVAVHSQLKWQEEGESEQPANYHSYEVAAVIVLVPFDQPADVAE